MHNYKISNENEEKLVPTKHTKNEDWKISGNVKNRSEKKNNRNEIETRERKKDKTKIECIGENEQKKTNKKEKKSEFHKEILLEKIDVTKTHSRETRNTKMNISQRSPVEGEKILFIERTCGDKKFPGLSPFFIKKVVDNVAGGTVITAKQIRDGRILVHTATKKQTENFLKLQELNNWKVTTKEDLKSNQSRGVIFCRDLKYSSDEEICEELKSQGVTEVKRCKRRGINGENYDTGLFFMTFDFIQVPSELKIGYEIVEVRVFIPEPLRCFACLKFGHTKKNCRIPEEIKCGNCAENVHVDREKGEKCSRQQKCTNCGSHEHGSFEKTCLIYKMEKEISYIKVTKNVPYGKAKKEYMDKNPLRTRSFAAAVRKLPPEPTWSKNAPGHSKVIEKPTPHHDDVPRASGKPTLAPMEISSPMEEDLDESNEQKRGPSSPPLNVAKKKREEFFLKKQNGK